MTDQTPQTEALLLEGLELAFSTSGGNVQTPRAIFDFLRISYLPAIEAEVRTEAQKECLDTEGDTMVENGRTYRLTWVLVR